MFINECLADDLQVTIRIKSTSRKRKNETHKTILVPVYLLPTNIIVEKCLRTKSRGKYLEIKGEILCGMVSKYYIPINFVPYARYIMC